jgi:hypothetical protein
MVERVDLDRHDIIPLVVTAPRSRRFARILLLVTTPSAITSRTGKNGRSFDVAEPGMTRRLVELGAATIQTPEDQGRD